LVCYIPGDFDVLSVSSRAKPLGDAIFSHIRGQIIGRVDVSEPASISTSIAARYATAVYELAKDGKKIKAIETDLDALAAAMSDSSDLRALIHSPVYTREDQAGAIAALSKKMKLSPILSNTLALMAQKRRLFVLPQLISTLREIIATDKGEVTAEVISAKSLTKAQADKLAKSLKASTGKTVTLNATVDETLIGGLVVKVGSKMIDTSIRAKLSSLQNAMKEVG
jgi:F-type H+-transporting ATPase subunit delta